MDRYNLLAAKDLKEKNFLKKMEKKAKKYGKITFIVVSHSEVIIEGDNEVLAQFFDWLLRSVCLKQVRYLKFESEEVPES